MLLTDLAGPNAPAMGPDGKLYFPQVFADEIWSYDLDTGAARLVAGGIPRPTAVKFDSRGRIVTSVAGAGQILAIDVATGAQEVLAEVPLGIDNVSVGPDDRIFVSHFVDGRVAEETAGRQRVLSPPGLLGPHGLAVDADGTILFADGLSTGAVVAGVAERHHRLLVDLPTLAVGVAPFAGALVVLGATGELLRYDGSDAPTVLAGGSSARRPAPRRRAPAGGRAGATDGSRPSGATARRASCSRACRRRRPSTAAATATSSVPARPCSSSTAPGTRPASTASATPRASPRSGRRCWWPMPLATSSCVVDTASGRRDVVVSGAPVGPPVDGAVVPAAFAAVTADGAGGYLVGCNGDGSIRRLTPVA